MRIGIHAGQLRQGGGPCEDDPTDRRRRRRRQEFHAVAARQPVDRRAHQYPAGAGHGGEPGGDPPPGANPRRARQAGADRGAHRGRERHLRARPGRAVRRHAPRSRTATTACWPSRGTGTGRGHHDPVGASRTSSRRLPVGAGRRRPRSPTATWSICPRRTPTAASACPCSPAATWSIWRCRRRRTRARARPSPRRASSRRTRSRRPSCKVSRFPIRNRHRAAPPRRSSRTPCCRSR